MFRAAYPPAAARWAALGAIAGPLVFELCWLVLGTVSPGYTLFGHRFADYSPISQPVSGLGLGATAPYMNTAFVATGLILIVGVAGVYRTVPAPWSRTCTVLLGLTGVGQIICGIYDLEQMMPHSLGFLLAIGTPVIGFLVAGLSFRRLPGWRRFGTWLLAGSPLTLVLLVAFFLTFQQTAEGAEHGVAGLVQRLGIIEVHAWFVAMGWLAFRRAERGRP
ncbi:DUF998 domain-containing protein [Nonomuraea jiangxiensis]|uniref:DUF998 domain-containing protein n=1 Tax=Nonomuraea jiangxiensis TaxID=633440 RepID=A0A1G9C210_9ACTN|nr:DUF998 domain-containing protein [Nonomuraea jiangxiensis]SDK45727.1 Protein of unknown function [Nonomuraea jiangxiensis]